MKIHFLRTIDWFDTKFGNTFCVLVDTGKEYIIFDAGDYPKENDIRLAEKSARKIFKNTIAARDGFCLDV